AQSCRHRGYGRRPVQGHRRPRGEPAHQDHQHRGAADSAFDGVILFGILMRRAAAAALFVFASCFVGCAHAPPGTATHFMVAAAHPLAVDAGYSVLKLGGSALDAAIAVQLVLGLVEPESSGIGGGAFLLYWSAKDRTLRPYDGRETAPAAAKPDRSLKQDKRP